MVEGRFCFEGGSHCGKGEGLHVLITDQAKEVARDFDLASQGRLSPRRRPHNFKKNEGFVKFKVEPILNISVHTCLIHLFSL